MKKVLLLGILLISLAFTNVNSQSISVTVNSIDLKYQEIDAATWCPPGSVISANFLTRTMNISKNNVETFKAALTDVSKVDGNWVLTCKASDKTIKNAEIKLTLLSLTKAEVKITYASGKVENRIISL